MNSPGFLVKIGVNAFKWCVCGFNSGNESNHLKNLSVAAAVCLPVSSCGVVTFITPDNMNIETNTEDTELISISETAVVKLEEILKSSDGWSVEQNKNGIIIEKRSVENTPWQQFRLKTTINAPIADVFNLLVDVSHRQDWDNVVQVYKNLVQLNSEVDLTYCRTGAMLGGLVGARDYLDIRVSRKRDDGTYITGGQSVTSTRMPEQQGYIRAINFPCGYLLLPADDGKSTNIIYMAHADLKGNMSSWVVSKGMNGALTKIFENLKNYFAKTANK